MYILHIWAFSSVLPWTSDALMNAFLLLAHLVLHAKNMQISSWLAGPFSCCWCWFIATHFWAVLPNKGHFHFNIRTHLISVIFLSLRLGVVQVCVSISHSSLWTPLRRVYRVSRASTRPGDLGASMPVSLLLQWALFQMVRFIIHFNCLKTEDFDSNGSLVRSQ